MNAPPIEPFRVMDCAPTILALGRSAQTLRELRDHLAAVPLQSILHHFYGSLLRPAFDHPEYRNDFALWVRQALHDAPLAERLGVIDPMLFKEQESLRQHLIDVIEDRLAEVDQLAIAPRGREFHFLRAQFVVLDTGWRAETPGQLGALIPRLSTGSVYFHFIEARRRAPLLTDDFSAWLTAWGPAQRAVLERLEAIDFQLWTLTELRKRISDCFPRSDEGRSGGDD
jgi:hypothetical protein